MANEYCTVAEVKSRLDITDNANDTEIAGVIEAVSRAIDTDRGRVFYTATATRYYSPRWDDYLLIDDCQSVTTLQSDEDGDGTFETTWTEDTDFFLMPFTGPPYDQIVLTTNGNYTFPIFNRSVKITGVFGYSATTPPAIREACILASMRVWKRRDVLFGTAGNAELGTIEAIAPIMRDGELSLLLDTVERSIV